MSVVGPSASSRFYVFMSIRVTSLAVYTKARQAFRLSILIICLAAISLITGIVGNRYIYGILANLVPIILPFVVFEGVQQKLWGKELLKTQCLLGTVYALALVIMDSIMFAFTVTNFRYCYGSWHSQCEGYKGVGSFDLQCHSTTTPNSTSELFVTCQTKEEYVLQMICLGLNLLHSLCIAPYLLFCHGLKTAINSSLPAWEDGSVIVLDPLPEDLEVPASRPVVLYGRDEEIDENELVDGYPVLSKIRDDCTNESRDEILLPRIPASIAPTSQSVCIR